MFESAELGHKVDKKRYAEEVPALRAALLEAQYQLKDAPSFAVVILINGVDGAGKGETVNLLHAWMDPRYLITHAFGTPSDEERERPEMWRFWRALPPKGRIGILFGNWYTDPILDRAAGKDGRARFEARLADINRFEEMLAQEGVLLLKFWFHLSKRFQKKRLQTLSSDPNTRWRVTPTDWAHFAQYDKFRKVSALALERTSTGYAPWTIVEGADPEYRSLLVGRALLDAVSHRLELAGRGFHSRQTAAPLPPRVDQINALSQLVLDQPMTESAYERALERWQGKLNLLSRHEKFAGRGVVVVFEGMDAAGKGGTIRRVTAALDARQYHVVPIAAPTEEERALPYLWRFWRHVPRRGRFVLFDRSWYGRVLVERVEGYCQAADWMRAYAEINHFEEQLVRSGFLVVKFWLSVSADEQLRRFQEREQTSFKHYKITPEDWRNRERWPAYAEAVCDMIDRTSTTHAPWVLVEADNKYHARIKVLRTLSQTIERALK